ncbi:MAG: hypothetical protein SGARI_005385 [Bacillariaceae sp.]
MATMPPGKVVILDPNISITLPTLPYGYRTTRASWEELVQIIREEQDIPKLSRSAQQQHDYEVFRQHMKEQYASSLDYILIAKFGLEAVAVKNTMHENPESSQRSFPLQRWKAKQSLAEIETPMTVLIPNDFPYYNETGVEQYVYWKTNESISEEEILQVQKDLRQNFGADDILFWVNPTALQSLPEVEHDNWK